MIVTVIALRILIGLSALGGALAFAAVTVGERLPSEGVVAFVSDRQHDEDIYLLDVGTQSLYRLIAREGQDRSPAWSPDGHSLAFTSSYHLYVLNLETHRLRRLSRGGRAAWPSWSPDGTQIAFAFAAGRSDLYQLFVVGEDGSQPQQITESAASAMRPTWSPDGHELLFHVHADTSRLYRINLDTLRIAPVSAPIDAIEWASWSPDGAEIAARTYTNGSREIFVMDVDGEYGYRLSSNLLGAGIPSWTPDGKQVVFYAAGEDGYDLYIVDADGHNRRRLTSLAGNEMFPAVKPLN
jgi:Tol biopolymer transport system component